MERPCTPKQDTILKVPDTEERSHYFWHFDHRRPDETMREIADAHGISERTGLRWRQERDRWGDGRRTRKRKAEDLGHKLGRPFRVPDSQLQALLEDNTNPVRDAPLSVQQRENEIPLAPRSLRYNLSNRENAHMYISAYSGEISTPNKRQRVRYGEEHEKEDLHGFWDTVFFTDEAHFNPEEDFQKPRILRRKGNPNRLKRGNLQTRKKKKSSPLTLHIYASVNWFFKSPLGFYNDEKDMLKPPKQPPKPRRSKYETDEQFAQRKRDHEASLPPPLEVVSCGHHITQKYYTNHILPMYIKWIHEARMRDSSREWRLQEDGDPSHGTKSKDNVAETLRQAMWIDVIVHPAQSPDLNPIEGIWLILKQRVKRRLRYPEEDQPAWDGTKKHLKKILQEVWDTITMDEIRDRIADLPDRCHELTENGGEKIRSKKW